MPGRPDELQPRTTKKVILVDVFNYRRPSGVASRPFDTLTARQGDEVELTDEEIARAAELDRTHPVRQGARLGSPEDLQRVQAAEAETTPVDESRLRAMTLDEVAAWLNQHPEQADHVLALEEASDEPRQPVIEIATDISASHLAQLQAAARDNA